MMRHSPQRRTQKYFSRECLVLIKYSNGGRSGVEPDFLKHIMLLYSAYNFSNRIFLFNYIYYNIYCRIMATSNDEFFVK